MGTDLIGENDQDFLGFSLSINADGTVVAMGGNGNNNWAGYVRVFQYNNNDWGTS